jgi:hypothetical protein
MRRTTSKQNTERQFVLCLRNDECEDLKRGKVYEVLSDASAAKDGYIRVVDESGEDYFYFAPFFEPLKLSRKVQQALAAD